MTAHELVSQVKNLPPVSQAALKLVGLLDQPDVRNEDIVAILKFDSALTGNLLRVCNSPFIGLRERVASVDQAVLMLGHQQLLQITLALGFGNAMAAPLAGYAVEPSELWRHSLVTALAAEVVADASSGHAFELAVAFTAGLLHDIGKLAMNQVLTPAVQTGLRTRIEQEGLSRSQAEKDILKTNHAEVGACLLERWRLPEVIVEAVAHHHQPVSQPRPLLSSVVHVANCLAHLIGSTPGWDSYAMGADAAAAESIGVKPDNLEGLLVRVHGSLKKVEGLTVAA